MNKEGSGDIFQPDTLKEKLLQSLDVIETYAYRDYEDLESNHLKVKGYKLIDELRAMFPDFPEYRH